MNQVQMIQLLNTLDIPSFYGTADDGQPLPFLTIHVTQPENFAADNQVYCEKWHFRIDLYSAKKDLDAERKIKKLLKDNNIFWVRDENFIESEHAWEVEFDFDVIGDESEEAEVVSDGTEGNTSP